MDDQEVIDFLEEFDDGTFNYDNIVAGTPSHRRITPRRGQKSTISEKTYGDDGKRDL